MNETLKILLGSVQPGRLEAGCDEAGRGCLAGPVYAAAVILPENFYHPQLNDSKQVKEPVRNELRTYIEKHAVCYAVACADNCEIDKTNILKASILSMHRALKALSVQPAFILVDGNKFASYNDIPHTCIVKGDSIYASIAAASILAKTYRDEYMNQIAEEYPDYQWEINKGYPTKTHREAVAKFGLSPYHRKSFCKKTADYRQLTLF
ncbi:MAG: ribonuclease HII [Prevotellaceae bacterium]|jgi:ribonuclease HII|nr:ribonuclease HII [Prevotellaceae bacterium]